MASWDEDSPALRANLDRIARRVSDEAKRREPPTAEQAKSWQREIMFGLDIGKEPKAAIGAFRGEAGLERYNVKVGFLPGVDAAEVAGALATFEAELQRRCAELDRAIPSAANTADEMERVVALCAWAHAEWVRIHPFANGNGRTARLWANYLAARYGLPPFVALRPRPEGQAYAFASMLAMLGEWTHTESLFRLYLALELKRRRGS